MDKPMSNARIEQHPAPQLLQHMLDTKLWVEHNENEDDFYANLGHSFDYQPDSIGNSRIETELFTEAENHDMLNVSEMKAKHSYGPQKMMESGFASEELDEAKITESETKRTRIEPSADSKEHTNLNGINITSRLKDDSVKSILLQSELACEKWSETVTQCDEHFGRLQHEIHDGLESFEKTVASLVSYSKSVLEIVDQLRLKTQLVIEDGEAKVQVGKNLRAMLVDAHRIAKSFEQSVSMQH